MSEEKVTPKKFEQISKIAGIIVATVTGLVTMANGAHALYQYAMLKKIERKQVIIKQLTTFGSFAQMVEEHRKLAPMCVQYVSYIKKENPFEEQHLRALLKKYGNGAGIYYSGEFKTFRALHHFYEELALQVELGALDFDLIFDMVAFPTDFTAKTEQLCRFLGDNWFDPGKGIKGMCARSLELAKQYEKERARK